MSLKNKSALKMALNARLKAEGNWRDYNRQRELLKESGVAESEAWRVAAYPFPPRDGSEPEIVNDPLYAEIIANWQAGKYQAVQPVETSLAGQSISESSNRLSAWQKLAEDVGDRAASELDEARWVVANYLRDTTKIRADDVPSTAALGILSWVQASSSNYGDFLRTIYTKILPDRRAIEHEARFFDDGRKDLLLIEEFERSLELEHEAEEEPIKLEAAG